MAENLSFLPGNSSATYLLSLAQVQTLPGTATQLEISLTRALSLLSQAGGSGRSNLSIRYRKDY